MDSCFQRLNRFDNSCQIIDFPFFPTTLLEYIFLIKKVY